MKRSTIHILLAALTTIIPFAAFANDKVQAPDTLPTPESRCLLFNRGDLSSEFWRIPALATTNDGVVIAAADRRNESNSDLPGNIDIVIRRSLDSGLTWDAPRIILKCDSTGGYGDAALGVHRPTGDVVLVAAHGNGVWESTAADHQRVVVTRSSDNGASWTQPVDITDQLYDPAEGAAPLTAFAGFATSGVMFCDDDGTLAFLLVTRQGEKKWGPLSLYLCYSTDGGHSWHVDTTPIDNDADESKIARLADGTYYISIRNRRKGPRKVSRSESLHGPWSEPVPEKALIDPGCNGDLIVITPERLKALGINTTNASNGLMVHSLANDPRSRRNVSIFTSDDLGRSWRKIFTVCPYPSAYSALTLMPDGTLGCLTEEGATEGGWRLWFTRIDLSALLNQPHSH